MSRRCDLCPRECTGSVVLSLGGTSYEVFLCADHERRVGSVIEPWIARARERKSLSGAGGYNPSLVRRWADAQGIDVRPNGRIPVDVVERYFEFLNQSGRNS